MILIISPADDMHTRCVAQDLTANHVPYRIVDARQLIDDARLWITAGQSAPSASRWTDVDGRVVDLASVTTVWHRRRFLPVPAGLPDPDQEQFVRREWGEATGGALSSLDAWLVNDPFRELAASKPLQLRLAESVGLRVPATLITNDADAVLGFVEHHRGQIIHKSFTTVAGRFRPTQRWTEGDRAALEGLRFAPVIFQELVPGTREVRVVMIGDRLFAAAFEPAPGLVDGRMDLDTPYRPHELPGHVTHALGRMMARLGLVYASIDLRITDEGEYVFLEVNPQGQYLYVEVLTDLPLTRAMASLLAEGSRSFSRPSAIPPSAHLTAPLWSEP